MTTPVKVQSPANEPKAEKSSFRDYRPPTPPRPRPNYGTTQPENRSVTSSDHQRIPPIGHSNLYYYKWACTFITLLIDLFHFASLYNCVKFIEDEFKNSDAEHYRGANLSRNTAIVGYFLFIVGIIIIYIASVFNLIGIFREKDDYMSPWVAINVVTFILEQYFYLRWACSTSELYYFGLFIGFVFLYACLGVMSQYILIIQERSLLRSSPPSYPPPSLPRRTVPPPSTAVPVPNTPQSTAATAVSNPTPLTPPPPPPLPPKYDEDKITKV